MQYMIEFLAGLAFFIYAMFLLEDSLKQIAARTFKLFMRRHTNNRWEAIGSSALVTGLLQSSSVIIMMVLAFVGAGIVSIRNALAMTLGSHFGTTLDSWLVATVGFKMQIDLIALPMLIVAVIGLAFIEPGKKIRQWARFIFGVGLLFLGLEYMKTSMGYLLEGFHFSRYEGYPLITFLFLGLLITALIQSSSATMAIVLSALYTGAIPFQTAAALVIGAEIGTTVKLIFGALKGSAAKRQLSIGNIIFNISIATGAYIFIGPLIRFATSVFGGGEPLLQLVLFQSVINLIGVLLFAPFLDPFSKFLEKNISGTEERSAFVVGKEALAAPNLAIDAMEQDTELLIHRVLRINLEAFATEKKIIHAPPGYNAALSVKKKKIKTYEKKYEDIKKTEGEVLMYALKMVYRYPEHQKRAEELISAVRFAVHSAKAMKDVRHNRIEFRESGNDAKHNFYTIFRKEVETLYSKIDDVMKTNQPARKKRYDDLLNLVYASYFSRQTLVYEAAQKEEISAADISSLLNVNRELYTSGKTIIEALRMYYNGDGVPFHCHEFP